MTNLINLTELREAPSNLVVGQPYATVNVPAYALLALLDVAEAAHRANIPAACGCGKNPCPNELLLRRPRPLHH